VELTEAAVKYVRLVFASLLLAGSAAPAQRPIVRVAPSVTQDQRGFSLRLLAAHNQVRAAAGVPALQWDPVLAAAAASYGPRLAAYPELEHSPRAERPGQAENLFRGQAGRYSLEAMVDNWVQERRLFRPGLFPAVSSSGNWIDVSHYTQMIWPTTTKVGCAVHKTLRWEYLICRYSPRGNRDGVQLR
jgi:hypothetical protein